MIVGKEIWIDKLLYGLIDDMLVAGSHMDAINEEVGVS